ncbi:hypothetical protein ACLBWZ_12920 [Brucellaceae bacterium C25G]
MKKALLAITLVMLSAAPSLACTAEEAQTKANEVTTKLQELAVKDPNKAVEVSQKIQQTQAGLSNNPDLEAICKAYDEMLAMMD